jgi:hypothetical protein
MMYADGLRTVDRRQGLLRLFGTAPFTKHEASDDVLLAANSIQQCNMAPAML